MLPSFSLSGQQNSKTPCLDSAAVAGLISAMHIPTTIFFSKYFKQVMLSRSFDHNACYDLPCAVALADHLTSKA